MKRRKVADSCFSPNDVATPVVSALIQQPQPLPEQQVDWVPCFHTGRDMATVPDVIPLQLSHPAFEEFCHITHLSSQPPPALFVDLAFDVRTDTVSMCYV
jgi:hypothetical protein